MTGHNFIKNNTNCMTCCCECIKHLGEAPKTKFGCIRKAVDKQIENKTIKYSDIYNLIIELDTMTVTEEGRDLIYYLEDIWKKRIL